MNESCSSVVLFVKTGPSYLIAFASSSNDYDTCTNL